MEIFLALGALTAGAQLVLFRPYILFPVLLVVSAVFDISVRAGPVAVHPSNVILLALLAGTLLHRIRTRTFQLSPYQGVLVAIGSWIVFVGMLKQGPGTLKRILAIALMGCAFEATMQAVRTRQDLLNLRHWVAVSGTLAAITGWILRSGGEFNGRAAGVFGNPNGLGMYLAGCLPLSFSVLLTATRKSHRYLAGAAVLVTASGLWISGSRGALVGALCGCVFVGSRHLRQALFAGLLLGGGLILLTVVEESEHGFERIPNAAVIAPVIFENSKVWLALNGFEEISFSAPPWAHPGDIESFPQSLGARMMIWYQGIRIGLNHPWTGVGTGNSRFAAIPFDSKVFNNCFNIYLASFVEGGLPGLLLHFLWLRILLAAILSSLVTPDPERIRTATSGASLAFLIHGMVEDTYFSIYPNWLIGIVFAMTLRGSELPLPLASPPEPADS